MKERGQEQGRTAQFRSFDQTVLSYTIYGSGNPALLLHGFSVNSRINWSRLILDFVDTGRQIITLDARGHGRSQKPHIASAYADRAMARDVSALLDRLGIASVDLIGCSLGGFTAVESALRDARIRRLALNGVGLASLDPDEMRSFAGGLREEDPSEPSFYRSLADRFGADRLALAACLEGMIYPQVVAKDLEQLSIPVLVVNGEDDFYDAREFSSYLPLGEARIVPGDHISCLQTPELKACLVDFLTDRAD